ncbi:hypothetical protein ACW73L_18760 [Methylolobus aquaticus]
MKTKTLNRTIALILSGAMATSVAFAARPPGVGGGGGGGGEETAAQNLSVPAILVGSLGTLVCGPSDSAPSDLVPPTGTPQTGYELPGYYWVQKVNTWQAQCFNAAAASVYGNWGDNLTGDAKLSTGSPIRVELVLTNMTDFTATISDGTLQGYNVVKLQPSTLDRLSAYGHLAGGDAITGWNDIPVDVGQASWVVHDAGMQISVQNLGTGAFAVPLQPIAPEINATGKIVYGYNLRVTAAGDYQIRFNSTPAVTFTGCDAGTCTANGNDAYLNIKVTAKASGGGKTGGKPK